MASRNWECSNEFQAAIFGDPTQAFLHVTSWDKRNLKKKKCTGTLWTVLRRSPGQNYFIYSSHKVRWRQVNLNLNHEYNECCLNQNYSASASRSSLVPSVFGLQSVCTEQDSCSVLLPLPLSFTEFILSLYSCTSCPINNLLVSASE